MESTHQMPPDPNANYLQTLHHTYTSKVGRVLEALAQLGDTLNVPNEISPFHSISPPNISVHAYYVYVSINSGLSDN